MRSSAILWKSTSQIDLLVDLGPDTGSAACTSSASHVSLTVRYLPAMRHGLHALQYRVGHGCTGNGAGFTCFPPFIGRLPTVLSGVVMFVSSSFDVQPLPPVQPAAALTLVGRGFVVPDGSNASNSSKSSVGRF